VKRFVTLATLVATLVAVASIFPAAVAQGQTAANESGRLGWCELLTHDAAKAAQFYAELFGWQLENHTAGKYRLRSQGTLVGGITEIGYITPELDEATWLVGITVDDVEASVAAARERGGKILADVTRATSGARWAVVEDLQGAQLLVFSGGDLIDDTEGPGRWMWTELWTTDPEDAAAFYADVVGWTLEELEHPDGAYPAFHKGGEARSARSSSAGRYCSSRTTRSTAGESRFWPIRPASASWRTNSRRCRNEASHALDLSRVVRRAPRHRSRKLRIQRHHDLVTRGCGIRLWRIRRLRTWLGLFARLPPGPPHRSPTRRSPPDPVPRRAGPAGRLRPVAQRARLSAEPRSRTGSSITRRRSPPSDSLPEHGHAVLGEGGIACHADEALAQSLCGEQAVERVAVVAG